MAKPSTISDRARVDALQRFVLKERALLIHSGVLPRGFLSLFVDDEARNLREALDDLVIAQKRRDQNRRAAENVQLSTLAALE